MKEDSKEQISDKFITYLFSVKHKDDRGTLAVFKKALKNTAKSSAMPYLIEYCVGTNGSNYFNEWSYDCYRIVAGIFANDKSDPHLKEKADEAGKDSEGEKKLEEFNKPVYGNFGKDLSEFYKKSHERQNSDSDNNKVDPFTKRFMHLLAADGEEIFDRVLRLAMRIQRDNKSSINYPALLNDLLRFRYSPEEIKKKWSKDYFIGIYNTSSK